MIKVNKQLINILENVPCFSFSLKLTGRKKYKKIKIDPPGKSNFAPWEEATRSEITTEVWETEEIKNAKFDRYSVSPHSYYITQGKGTERPFTGKYWAEKELGTYSCQCCGSELFLSDHKFQAPNGLSNFWISIKNATEILDDAQDVKIDTNNVANQFVDFTLPRKRVVCTKCKSHLGTVTEDGPPPTFKRMSINSGALNFKSKPWFYPPQYYRKLRMEKKREEIKIQEQNKVIERDAFDEKTFKSVEAPVNEKIKSQ